MGLGVIAAVAVPVIAYLLTQDKGKAAPAAGVPVGVKSVAQRMAEVIATGDPATIRAEAIRLRAEGRTSEPAELERVAGLIAQQLAKPGAPPPVVVQVPSKTPMPTPVANPPVQPTGPNAPWLTGVPADLQGVTLRATSPVAYDPRVVTLQNRLIDLGWKSLAPADGKFGANTAAAVKAFQSLNGVVPVDGIVGPITLIKLADAGAKGPGSAPVVAPKPAPAVVKAPAAKPAPAPAAKPAPAPAAPPAQPAGKAPTITTALKTSGLLRNGKTTGYKAPASSGQAVRDWQQVLFDLGFLQAKPDGAFGDATEAATRAFQTAANTAAAKSGKPKLSVDGIVGPATVGRAAEARVMASGPAVFTGDYFGDDSGPMRAPFEPQPDSPLPGIMPVMAPAAPDARRGLAARLYNMLELAPRGGEDKSLVALYQSQEGLKPTGFYGPGTALSLAQTYGIVPPKPLYWTDSRTRASKGTYRDAMRVFGERDPQRVEEWKRAGAV